VQLYTTVTKNVKEAKASDQYVSENHELTLQSFPLKYFLNDLLTGCYIRK